MVAQYFERILTRLLGVVSIFEFSCRFFAFFPVSLLLVRSHATTSASRVRVEPRSWWY